jgi:hypothetical protein
MTDHSEAATPCLKRSLTTEEDALLRQSITTSTKHLYNIPSPAQAVAATPIAWLSTYDGHSSVTTDPDTMRQWRDTLNRPITPLYAGVAQPIAATPSNDIANKIELHLNLDKGSPGFHLSDDDLREVVRALRGAAQARRDPEVVAAVQQAIMKHPHFEWGACTAFGLANTAIDAYALAVSSPHRE